MKTIKKKIWCIVCLFAAFILIGGGSSADTTVTITGIINAIGQIEVSDEDIYDIETNEIGDELSNMVGQSVRVSGSVYEEDGRKTISVKSYDVIDEESEDKFDEDSVENLDLA